MEVEGNLEEVCRAAQTSKTRVFSSVGGKGGGRTDDEARLSEGVRPLSEERGRRAAMERGMRGVQVGNNGASGALHSVTGLHLSGEEKEAAGVWIRPREGGRRRNERKGRAIHSVAGRKQSAIFGEFLHRFFSSLLFYDICCDVSLHQQVADAQVDKHLLCDGPLGTSAGV